MAKSGTGTPLGRPVVPEVDIIMKRSSALRMTGAKSAEAAAKAAARSRSPAGKASPAFRTVATGGASGISAILARLAGLVTTSFAPLV